MRIIAAALVLTVLAYPAVAQQPATKPDSPHSTGRTVLPAEQGVMQPQGPTGPINTTSGGAPPESPQGQTPPGMQSAPEGSSKTIVEPAKK